MKWQLVTSVYNREEFIGAYLDQWDFVDNITICLGTRPWKKKAIFYAGLDVPESEEHDNSEKIIKKYFPQAKIIKGEWDRHAEQVNSGLNQEYDFSIVTACDLFFTKDDIYKIKDFVEKTNVDAYRIEYKENFIDFFYDWNYGKKNLLEDDKESFIVKPKLVECCHHVDHRRRDRRPLLLGGNELLIPKDITGYHFRNAKKIHKVKPGDGNWIKAPDEIINRLKKWRKLLS